MYLKQGQRAQSSGTFGLSSHLTSDILSQVTHIPFYTSMKQSEMGIFLMEV